MGLPAEAETTAPSRDLVLSENALGLTTCSFASLTLLRVRKLTKHLLLSNFSHSVLGVGCECQVTLRN